MLSDVRTNWFSNCELGDNRLQEDIEIQNLKNGDVAFTEKFVREHTGWMLSVSRQILRDDTLAEDSVQVAFANIFGSLHTFRGHSRIRTWMHVIVVNQALMALRKQKRLQETPIDDLLPVFDDADCRVEGHWVILETPESLLERAQTKEVVLGLIDQLPENYRIVLLLRDIEELDTLDVAKILELSESNVKVRLHRARSALKKLLEPLLRGQKL